MPIKWIAVSLSLLLFCFVLELVRRERLTFKYALGWLITSVFAIFFALFHKVLFKFSAWIGFELPSNFIFFAILCVFVFLSLLLTVFLCQQNSRNDRMAQKIGLLEFEITQLKNKINVSEKK